MKNLLALARPLTAFRQFSAGPALREAIKIIPRPMEPQRVEDVVAYRHKYFTPSDLRPLAQAPELYARIHVHKRNLLVTEGDVIKLPVNMKDVKIGDTLAFDQCSEIGSRDYTLSGQRIDPAAFTIKGVVLEKTRVKRTILERTRRRRRHVRHVVQNNSLTVIRIAKIDVNQAATSSQSSQSFSQS